MNRTLLLCLLVASAACDDDSGPAPAGSLTVAVQVAAGGNADPDGFRIIAEKDTVLLPSTGGTAEFDGLPVGRVVARIAGLAPWCDGTPLIQAMNIVDGETATMNIAIQCHTAYGTVRLITDAEGIDLDADGYTVTAGGVDHPTGARDTLVLSLPSGIESAIDIRGIRRTCWPATDSTRLVTPTLPGGTVDVTFTVDCGVILYQGFTIGSPPRFYQLNVTSGEVRQLASFPNNVQSLRSSWDGSQILFISNDLYTMPPSAVAPVQRTATAELEAFASWAPDGGSIYYSTIEDQVVHRLVLGGGTTVVPGGVESESYPTMRLQGDLIAYQFGTDSGSRVMLMAPDGTGRHSAFTGSTHLGQPSWSPDGSTLATFGSTTNMSGPTGIYVGTPGSVAPTVRSAPPSISTFDHDPLWSSDGEWIAFVRNPGDGSAQTFHLMRPDGTGFRTVPIGHTWNGEYTWLR